MTARTASLALAALAVAGSLAAQLAVAQEAPRAAPKAAAPQQPGIQVPQPEVLLILIRSAMIGLDHANRTGNYSVLRELGGPALQQNSSAQLSGAFANLRANKVDLLVTAVSTPQLMQQPKVSPDGLLQLVGFFPTQPRRIQFNIVYQPVSGQWRLAGLNVGLVQAAANTPTAEAPPKPAETSKAKAPAAPTKKEPARK
jgi:hypothetical protein